MSQKSIDILIVVNQGLQYTTQYAIMDKPYEEIGNCTITVISGLKTEGGERNEISK